MRINKHILIILPIITVISCHSNDTNKTSSGSSPNASNNPTSNLFAATVNGRETFDKAPLVLFNKTIGDEKESINISGVFNDINSHIGLMVVSEKGSLHSGRYAIQSDSSTKTNARYETNVNGGATLIDNTLFNGTGNITVTEFDTSAKRIVAVVEMDATNKINQKVHITGRVNSSYK